MVRLSVVAMIAAGLLAGSKPAIGGPPLLQTPKVLTDGYVDTTGIEGIVEAFFGPAQAKLTDEQKVLNFYHWYRRAVYPFRYMAADRRDVLKSINTAGFNLCGSQAAVCVVILQKAGYKTHVLQGDAGPEWGHTFWEVQYDNGWHLFDAMSAFYVLTRGDQPHVAGLPEIKADPTLVTKAVEEKRAPPEFVYSQRKHEITLEEREQFVKDIAEAMDGKQPQDVPWSLLVTKPGSLVDFWNRVATGKKIKFLDEKGTNGGKYTPGVLDIKLKANERYVRQWSGDGKWLTKASFVKYPPANMAAGGNEHLDPVNFKYFEPYRQDKPNPFNDAVYRTYGNGYLEWTPATAEQLAQGVETMTNLKADPAGVLSVEDAAKPAELILAVKSPYGVVEIELQLGTKDSAAAIDAQLLVGGKPVPNKKVSGADKLVIATGDVDPPIYEYQLKLAIRKADGLAVKSLKTTFQCNPMVLPGLLPGVNKVRVTAAQPGKIDGGNLIVTHSWFDPPDWSKSHKIHVKQLDVLPADYEIALPAGEKLPKMEKLELFLKAD